MIGIRLKEADSEASGCRDINFFRKKHRCFKSSATLTYHGCIEYWIFCGFFEFSQSSFIGMIKSMIKIINFDYIYSKCDHENQMCIFEYKILWHFILTQDDKVSYMWRLRWETLPSGKVASLLCGHFFLRWDITNTD